MGNRRPARILPTHQVATVHKTMPDTPRGIPPKGKKTVVHVSRAECYGTLPHPTNGPMGTQGTAKRRGEAMVCTTAAAIGTAEEGLVR